MDITCKQSVLYVKYALINKTFNKAVQDTYKYSNMTDYSKGPKYLLCSFKVWTSWHYSDVPNFSFFQFDSYSNVQN